MFQVILFMCFFLSIHSNNFKIESHPTEKKCLFIHNLNFPLSLEQKYDINKIFNKYPILIFRDSNKIINTYDQQNLHDIISIFDHKYINNNLSNIILPLNVKNYRWKSNLIDYYIENQRLNPNPISIFHNPDIINNDKYTAFICGETIYENLEKKINKFMLNKLHNTYVIVNKYNFEYSNKVMDYTDSFRITDSDIKYKEHDVKIPLIFDNNKLLIVPSIVENIVGYNYDESNLHMKYFMENFVLPHKFLIKWKKNDICFINTNCFIYSNVPP